MEYQICEKNKSQVYVLCIYLFITFQLEFDKSFNHEELKGIYNISTQPTTKDTHRDDKQRYVLLLEDKALTIGSFTFSIHPIIYFFDLVEI